jgi:hypothetical protein
LAVARFVEPEDFEDDIDAAKAMSGSHWPKPELFQACLSVLSGFWGYFLLA